MALENVDAYVATIDENGNIEIKISKHNEDILQAFRIRENRKGIIRLKEVAAYNVAQYHVILFYLDNNL